MPIDITVVIPCRNGAAFIANQLDALLAQVTDASFEVIVADNISTDATAAVVSSYSRRDPRVRLVDASRAPGANVARNIGVAAARGEVALLTDADDLVHPGWIQAYWSAFGAGTQSAGGGINRVLADGTALAAERRLYRSAIADAQFANTTNCAFTVAAFHAVGGFDESFAAGADEVMFFRRLARAGYRLELVADAVVDKVHHADLGDTFHQYFNFGRGEALLARTLRPRMFGLVVALAGMQSIVWGVLWTVLGRFPRTQRKIVCTLAFNLGALCESIRIRAGARPAWTLPGRGRGQVNLAV